MDLLAESAVNIVGHHSAAERKREREGSEDYYRIYIPDVDDARPRKSAPAGVVSRGQIVPEAKVEVVEIVHPQVDNSILQQRLSIDVCFPPAS